MGLHLSDDGLDYTYHEFSCYPQLHLLLRPREACIAMSFLIIKMIMRWAVHTTI